LECGIRFFWLLIILELQICKETAYTHISRLATMAAAAESTLPKEETPHDMSVAIPIKEQVVLPQPITGNGYRYIPYEEIEATFFSSPEAELPTNQLVWVLQSKGRKRKKRKRQSPESSDTIATANSIGATTANGQQESNSKNQRLVLFLRARVLKQITFQGEPRIQVQYPKGSTYCVQRDHLVPVLEHFKDVVVVAPETTTYRRLCVVHSQPKEVFLEIGCDAGDTVARVRETGDASRIVLGIDTSVESIQDAVQRYPALTEWLFEWDILTQEPPPAVRQHTPAVVAVDIKESRTLPAVLDCLQAIWKLWRPRIIIVKSRSLYAIMPKSCADYAISSTQEEA
jgi:hypothetical protein